MCVMTPLGPALLLAPLTFGDRILGVDIVIIPVIMPLPVDFVGDSRLWEAKQGHAAFPELVVCMIFDSFVQFLGLFGAGVNPAVASLTSSFPPPGSVS